MDLLDALEAREGVVCTVGAGGKKSTLYTLAARAVAADIRRTVVTATVHIPIFDREVARVETTEVPISALEGNIDWPLGLVPERDGEHRYRGYDTDTVDAIARSATTDLVLVKADGARTREFKAPDDREPQIPDRADTVLPIASVQVVGEPLTDELVHRPERVSAITGLEQGDQIEPADVATVLASAEGGLKGVPDGASPIPVLNKVDDDELEATAREIAAGIHERADVPRVALTSMVADNSLVDVVD